MRTLAVSPTNKFKATLAALLFFIGVSTGSVLLGRVNNNVAEKYAQAHATKIVVRDRVKVVKVPEPFFVNVPGPTQNVTLPRGFKFVVVKDDGSDVSPSPSPQNGGGKEPPPQPKPNPNQTTINVPVPPPDLSQAPEFPKVGKVPLIGLGPQSQSYTGNPECIVSYMEMCVMEPDV